MSRVHFWSFLKDDQGRPISNADLKLYLNNTETEAIIYATKAASATSPLDQSTWTTNTSGYFEFYIGDAFETAPKIGYDHDTLFDLIWSASAHDPVASGIIDKVQPFWQVFPVDETSQNTERNKMLSNQLAYNLEDHIGIQYSTGIHNVDQVDYFDSGDSTRNKLVSNKLMYDLLDDLNTLLTCGGEAIAVGASYGPELVDNSQMEQVFFGTKPYKTPASSWTLVNYPLTKQDFNDYKFGLASFALSGSKQYSGISTNMWDSEVGNEYRFRTYIKIPQTIPITPEGSNLVSGGDMSIQGLSGTVLVPESSDPRKWGTVGDEVYGYDASFVSGAGGPNEFDDFDDLVPSAASTSRLFSDDLCNGGTATADSNGGASWTPDKAFDNNLTSYWAAGANCPNWLQYELPEAQQIQRLYIRGDGTGDGLPTTFDLQASNTGAFGGEEVTLLEVTNDRVPAGNTSWWYERYWTFSNENKYKYYRVNIYATKVGCGGAAGWASISEMELHEFTGSVWYRFHPEGSSHFPELVSAGDMSNTSVSGDVRIPTGWTTTSAGVSIDSDSVSPTASLAFRVNQGIDDWLPGFAGKRKDITLNKLKFGENLTLFPHAIHLSSSCGASGFDATEIFDDLGSNKYKIAITLDDGITELFGEIERWDANDEKAVIWTKLPSASQVYNGSLKIYWDPTHADNTTYIGDIGSTPGKKVWEHDFAAVWHMANNPAASAGGTLSESTSSGFTLNVSGGMGSGNLIDGPGDSYAIDFDATDDCAVLPNSAAMNYDIDDSFTIEFIGSTTRVGQVYYVGKYNTGGGSSQRGIQTLMLSDLQDPLALYLNDHGITNYIRGDTIYGNYNRGDFLYGGTSYGGTGGGGSMQIVSGAESPASDEWVKLHIVSAGSIGTLLNNGRWTIKGQDGTPIASQDLKMSEVRVSKIQRSDNWMRSTRYSAFDEINTFSTTENSVSSNPASAQTNTMPLIADDYQLQFYIKSLPSAGTGNLNMTVYHGNDRIGPIDSFDQNYSPYEWLRYQRIFKNVSAGSGAIKWQLDDPGAYKIDNVSFRRYTDKTGVGFKTNKFNVNNADRCQLSFYYRFTSAGIPSAGENLVQNTSNIDFTAYDGDGATVLHSATLPSASVGEWVQYTTNGLIVDNEGSEARLEWLTDGSPAVFEIDNVEFKTMQIGPGNIGELLIRLYNGDNTIVDTEVLTSASGYDDWSIYDKNFTITASGGLTRVQFVQNGDEPIYWKLDDVSVKLEFLPLLISSVTKTTSDFSASGDIYRVDVDHQLRRPRKYPIVQIWDNDIREQIRPAKLQDLDNENFRIWLDSPRNITVTTSGEVSG